MASAVMLEDVVVTRGSTKQSFLMFRMMEEPASHFLSPSRVCSRAFLRWEKRIESLRSGRMPNGPTCLLLINPQYDFPSKSCVGEYWVLNCWSHELRCSNQDVRLVSFFGYDAIIYCALGESNSQLRVVVLARNIPAPCR